MFTIQAELDTVAAKMEKEFNLKAGHLSKFVNTKDQESLDKNFLPSLVILPARLLKGYGEKMIIMASVVQFIFIAQIIHNRIPDECPKEAPQFPVLIGDYLFSNFFKFLSDHDLLEWLAPLASVICEMNEGGVVRWEILDKGIGTKADYLSVVKREHGLLAAQACRIGGALGQVHQEILDALEEFGLNLGMAWGTIREHFPLPPFEFLEKAREQLAKVPPGPERESLLALVEILSEKALTVTRACKSVIAL